MKRQRDSSSSKDPHTEHDLRCRIGTGNDCYDESLQQNNDDEDSIQNAWLNDRNLIQGNAKNNASNISESFQSEGLKSLSQQLMQVKRRLWPAAEECAAAWDSTPSEEFWNARAITNSMEALGECRHRGLNQMFINRSAIKLANIDAILDFKLTVPRVTNTGGVDYFLFADLCGAPGGFSEYIMKRIQTNETRCLCRGYGISLVGKNEHGKGATWRLEDYISQNDTTFLIHYGHDGTGDLYNWENVSCFQKDIERDLQGVGISQRKMNLVVADGGFDAQRDSECQEELAQKLVLCEFAVALELLDCGGTLIVKLFGCQTESIRMTMRYMYDLFDSLEMIKPLSSRPASSERYVVLTAFKGLPANWEGGRSWISNVLIGKCLQKDITFYSARVDDYLDQIDRDMLALNLKACFAILSHLERKAATKQAGKEAHFKIKRKHINIKMYKHAWQLFI